MQSSVKKANNCNFININHIDLTWIEIKYSNVIVFMSER